MYLLLYFFLHNLYLPHKCLHLFPISPTSSYLYLLLLKIFSDYPSSFPFLPANNNKNKSCGGNYFTFVLTTMQGGVVWHGSIATQYPLLLSPQISRKKFLFWSLVESYSCITHNVWMLLRYSDQGEQMIICVSSRELCLCDAKDPPEKATVVRYWR